jgi:hypothetical protein
VGMGGGQPRPAGQPEGGSRPRGPAAPGRVGTGPPRAAPARTKQRRRPAARRKQLQRRAEGRGGVVGTTRRGVRVQVAAGCEERRTSVDREDEQRQPWVLSPKNGEKLGK